MPSPNVAGPLSVLQLLNMDSGVSVLGGPLSVMKVPWATSKFKATSYYSVHPLILSATHMDIFDPISSANVFADYVCLKETYIMFKMSKTWLKYSKYNIIVCWPICHQIQVLNHDKPDVNTPNNSSEKCCSTAPCTALVPSSTSWELVAVHSWRAVESGMVSMIVGASIYCTDFYLFWWNLIFHEGVLDHGWYRLDHEPRVTWAM